MKPLPRMIGEGDASYRDRVRMSNKFRAAELNTPSLFGDNNVGKLRDRVVAALQRSESKRALDSAKAMKVLRREGPKLATMRLEINRSSDTRANEPATTKSMSPTGDDQPRDEQGRWT